jgi:rhodanese-related sulfurtransferase
MTSATISGIAEISREEITKRLDDPTLVIVDVLPAESYAAAHIPGARSLPLAEIEPHARELLSDRDADIAVYCAKFT